MTRFCTSPSGATRITSTRRSDRRMNSMWWNTLAFFGAVITPTKLDRLDSSCAALAMTRCGWSACSCASIGGSAPAGRQVLRLRRQHGVDEEAVAARRRDAAGAGVRAGDQAELLEIGHHVPDRRRRQLEAAGARACASRPAGRRRCSARPGLSAGSWHARQASVFRAVTGPILPASAEVAVV